MSFPHTFRIQREERFWLPGCERKTLLRRSVRVSQTSRSPRSYCVNLFWRFLEPSAKKGTNSECEDCRRRSLNRNVRNSFTTIRLTLAYSTAILLRESLQRCQVTYHRGLNAPNSGEDTASCCKRSRMHKPLPIALRCSHLTRTGRQGNES